MSSPKSSISTEFSFFFFFNDPATTEIYTLSLHDALPIFALATAFGTGPGILVNAGTGSIAYARDPAGELHRAGGDGWQLGDEGGGYLLGRGALDVPARPADGPGGRATPLPPLLGALRLRHL